MAISGARSALKHSDAELRRLALRGLGPESIDPLLEMVAKDREPQLRAEALTHLAAFAGERLWPVLAGALRSEHQEVRRAAVEAAGRTHDLASVPPLLALATDADPATVQAVAEALGKLGDPQAGPTLLRLLGHDSIEVRRAAVTALGLAGTIAAVEPLLGVSEGMLADGELQQAAREAVARIQSRLGNAEAGRLSLSEHEQRSGALSLTDAPLPGLERERPARIVKA